MNNLQGNKNRSFQPYSHSWELTDRLLLLLLLSRFSHVGLCATPETAAHQAPPSLGFSRQEHWSGLPFPSLMHESEKWKWKWSRVRLLATPWTAAYQAPPSMGFSRQEYWSGVPLPSPIRQVRKLKFSSHIFQVLMCVQAKCFLYASASSHVHSFNECNLAKTSIEYVTTLLKTLQWISVFAVIFETVDLNVCVSPDLYPDWFSLIHLVPATLALTDQASSLPSFPQVSVWFISLFP